jgi:hypothetical protein
LSEDALCVEWDLGAGEVDGAGEAAGWSDGDGEDLKVVAWNGK